MMHSFDNDTLFPSSIKFNQNVDERDKNGEKSNATFMTHHRWEGNNWCCDKGKGRLSFEPV